MAAGDAVVVTLKQPHRIQTREKGSRFIATAAPAPDEAEARAALDSVRAEFPDATHHVWGMILQGAGGALVERSHDAGEPAGTAGAPVLQAMKAAGLVNLIVVVTRYFGGVRLGKGGLARAYRDAAARVLEGAPKATSVPLRRLLIDVPLALDGEVRHLVARAGGRVGTSSYDTAGRSVLSAVLPAEFQTRVVDGIKDLARGQARIQDDEG